MTKQDCKFAPGTLVFESHGQDLVSVYVALGCSKYSRHVRNIQIKRECRSGNEFFLYLGTMDRWSHDKDDQSYEGDLMCSLPSVSVHPWDTHMRDCYSDSLGLKSSDSSYTKWAWRVALWRQWNLSPDSLVRLSPICKATLGDTEFSVLVDRFTAHFWIWPNCTSKS